LLIGAIGGYMVHVINMKVSFKQRTIDNKIKVYDAIITHWVRMRNFIFHELLPRPNAHPEFDKLYGESQAFIGEAILVSEDYKLTEDINALNERLYRTTWHDFTPEIINLEMEDIKAQGMIIINRMRGDIKKSSILELSDFLHIFTGK